MSQVNGDSILAKLEWLKRNNSFYQDDDEHYAYKVEETSSSIKQALELGEQYRVDANAERMIREGLQSKIDKYEEYVFLKELLSCDVSFRRKYYKLNQNKEIRTDNLRLKELEYLLDIKKIQSLRSDDNE